MKKTISFSVMFCLIFIVSIKAASNMSDLETQKERFSLAIITHDQDGFTRLMSENNNLFKEKYISGTSALHLAAHYVNFPAFVTLENQGLPVNYHDENRHTPLHELVKQPTPLLVELLADKKKSDYSSEELVILSENLLESNSLKIMSVILQKDPSSINDQNSLGRTAMHYVAMLDDTEYSTTLRQALLRYKPNLEMIDEFNKTAFDYAISNRNIPAVKDLLKAGFKLGIEESILLNLLKKENQTKQNLSQLLFDNVSVVPLSVLQIMIENGADVSVFDVFGMTALMCASGNNNSETVRAFLKAGADPNVKDRFGRTALWYANNAGVTKVLLEAGADPNISNKDGMTALMHATFSVNGTAEVFKALLKAGANPNAQDKWGITALMRAIIYHNNNAGVAKVLLEAGADVNIRDSNGETALDIARKLGRKETITLLEPHNTNRSQCCCQ